MAKNFLKSSLENASFNIIFQILFRCVTFVLNAFVLRHVNQAVIGVMNVRLLLLESTILFLSREAFRRACLSKTMEHNWAQVINLLWLTVPLCQVFSLIFGYIWLNVLTPPDESITQHYTIGVWSICLSCVLEMTCEPVYLVAQAFLFVRLRVVLETIHIAVRTITFTVLILRYPEAAVLAFSAAQVLAIVVYTGCYYTYFHHYMREMNAVRAYVKKEGGPTKEVDDDFPFEGLVDFLPSRIENQPIVNYGLAKLTWSFFKQGILKQVLTEGERYVMTLFAVLTFYEQGVYDVVNNLGSLAARFLFRPVEDSAYFYFSQMVGRDTAIQEQNQKHMAESSNVLYQLLRCISSVGLAILTFGQSYSKLLLFLYGGPSLVLWPAPMWMRAHCLAILLLAVNGITECYSFATMNTTQLDRYNYQMAILSVLFLVVSWALTTLLGGIGFILANCCNMSARIFHSVKFINARFQGTTYKPLRGLIPGPYFLVMLVVSAIITQISEVYLFDSSKLAHLFVGGFCFLLTLSAWVYEEKELTKLVINKWYQTSHQQKQD